MLDSVGNSTKLSGIHGVALLDVTAQGSSGDIKLVKGRSNDVPASADLAFVVTVQNQGERHRDTTCPSPPRSRSPAATPTQRRRHPSPRIGPTRRRTSPSPGSPSRTEALSKEVTLKVVAGPVKGERVETNNTATYKLLLQLQ